MQLIRIPENKRNVILLMNLIQKQRIRTEVDAWVDLKYLILVHLFNFL